MEFSNVEKSADAAAASRYLRVNEYMVHVSEVNDYADPCFCEYIDKNEKFSKTVSACSYGAHVEFFDQKRLKIS